MPRPSRLAPVLVVLGTALPLLGPAARANPPIHDVVPAPAEPTADKRPPLQISIDRARVDLPGHKLEAKLSRPAAKVKIKVYGNSGALLAEVEKTFGGAAPGTALQMSWTPSSEEDVAKIEVWGYDTSDFCVGMAITPWKTEIPHEEVNFETDSDVIRASEAPKLQASLTKIADILSKSGGLGQITLYVIGHTDTVGADEHNLTLSRRRAHAIAGWFKAHGLRNPIAYEGVGKMVPLVKTADQVDEPRNRRVRYVLSVDPLALPTAELSWKAP